MVDRRPEDRRPAAGRVPVGGFLGWLRQHQQNHGGVFPWGNLNKTVVGRLSCSADVGIHDIHGR